ncbi:two-component response regulator-like APRR2 isoform X1 [Capsicum annuum]|uniref:two-component response regulator-like APRR2 isoform X1 n=2 Tax=Capsicum annuum TaxID=4072 RepID=UPI001FB10248|nr:two-component response regulator-like APRR2 isoform X1 [Capsicum annuum]XP_016571232.2 two-component response regulator-like APRR2 isoform X1 [Capsicum annuum]XP_047250341.1 two-component response regulator-like APRR2 isoform X1 [Capsicum annuum]XP_047250345.1 two-component response regulator-like APRR2 isoform X1 [Capsicum annuum]XP_047250347.1 two-component response regulator-like APRR2 isoform X1 [Capsicum annuum]XP_047250350.1 two-component response regulator-like APRR2 isoform X1 [Caps
MICIEDELLGWKDFPKGLKVLLLDEDSNSAAEMKSRLEKMDYIVYTFCNESEALSAISSKSEGFHVAIVEVSAGDNDGVLQFLESAKNLPTIMTSNIHSLSTMMKCIALGAVEFLQKPLSDDKLKNIWQHVVHKAFNTRKDVSGPLEPVKESLLSMLQLQPEKGEPDDKSSNGTEPLIAVADNNTEQSSGCDKYPAPSTPQLKQGVRSVDDSDCHDHTIFSTDQDNGEHDGDTKSVETTYNNSLAENTVQISPPGQQQDIILKEENGSSPHQTMEADIATFSQINDCADNSDGSSPHQKTEADIATTSSQSKDCPDNSISHSAEPSKASGPHSSSGTKSNKKKVKVDWTPELHKKFVQAVEQLGIDQAIPSRILDVMKVEGLTRHNIASHLQKYRMHRRQILPREVERRWPHPQPRDSVQRNYYPHKPVMTFPPYHSNHVAPAGQCYPAWVPPASYPNGLQVWGSPYYPGWQPAETWHWKPHPGLLADTWGSPVMPPSFGSYPPYPQNAGMYQSHGMHNRYSMLEKSFDVHPAEEVIDKVVKEAITKPWLPLPLGLKPPSMEGVLDELSRQGISTVPPRINGSRCWR